MKKNTLTLMPEKPAWHEYAPGIEIELVPLTRSAMRRLLVDAQGDKEKYEAAVADHVIRNWKGLVNVDGNPLEVTPENKVFVKDNPTLSMWIDEMGRGLQIKEEEDLGN